MSDDQAQLLEALASPAAYPHAVDALRVVETHISWVVLTGSFAYKIKKPLKLPFLDFSTLALRERYCRDELRLNRRFAPDLYLDVVPIGGPASRPRVGSAPAIEFAVKMREFPREATADRLLAGNEIGERDFTTLAEAVADFHSKLAPERPDDAANRILENLGELEDAPGAREPKLAGIARLLRERIDALGPVLAARRASGAIRECHGDLHLGNVARIDGKLMPFDCLEFDRRLRTIDVIEEIAFLYMDLAARNRSDLAHAFVNRYLEITGDYPGIELLNPYAAHRALIRAKVAGIAQSAGLDTDAARDARRYLDFAARSLAPDPPLLVVTSGLSGSGKTFLGRQLVAALPAIQVRSDVERKRLGGLPPTASAAAAPREGLYSPGSTEATYRRLATIADAALAGGIDLIVDAAFLGRARRAAFREIAERRGARFLILRCEAAPETLRRRVRERAATRRDASDATESVLEHQLDTHEPIGPGESRWTLTVDTGGPVDAGGIAAEIRASTATSGARG
jgi:aminoglycoside phosphotransferase family enzyme/predicted kinase